jgi:hypothetical protein
LGAVYLHTPEIQACTRYYASGPISLIKPTTGDQSPLTYRLEDSLFTINITLNLGQSDPPDLYPLRSSIRGPLRCPGTKCSLRQNCQLYAKRPKATEAKTALIEHSQEILTQTSLFQSSGKWTSCKK